MKKIINSKRVVFLIVILTVISFSVTLISTYFDYKAAVELQSSALTNVVKGYKALIETLYKHKIPKDSIIHIINDKKDAHESIGITGEFVIGELVNDSLCFISRKDIRKTQENVMLPLDKSPGPIYNAIKNIKVSFLSYDYRGVKVYAATEHFAPFKWGIVAKTDAQEINAHFIESLFFSLLITVIMIIGGVFLFFKITNPMIYDVIKSEENLSITLNSIGDGVISTDKNGIVIGLNPVAASMCGWKLEEAKGKSLEEVFKIVNADTREIVINPVTKVIETGKIIGLANHTVLISKNGKEYHIADSAAPIRDENGIIYGVVLVFSDVTEKYISDKKIRESEAFIKTVMDNLPIGIAVNSVKPDVTFEYINDNFVKFYRTTKEKLEKPNNFWEAVYEDSNYREIIKKQILDDCASGNIERMHWSDVPISRKGEKTHYVSARNIPIEDYSMMISVVWDVTDRKIAENNLRNANEMLNLILNTIHQSIFWKDTNGIYLGCNKNFTEILGLDAPEDIIGKTDYDFPSLAAEAESYRADDKEVIESEKPKLHIIEPVRLSDTSIIWVDTSKAPLKDENGKVFAVLGVFEDITERINSEEELLRQNKMLEAQYEEYMQLNEVLRQTNSHLEIAKEIAEANEKKLKEAQKLAKIGNWELDLVNNKLYWSDEIYRIFGCEPREFKETYEAFLGFIHPEDRDYVNKSYTNHLESKLPYNVIHRILLPDDTIKYVNEQCNTDFDEKGIPIRSVGTVADISESILAQNELKKALEKAEESDKLKTAFLQNMSHEIRTPLNGILGFANLLSIEGLTQKDIQDYSAIILKSGNRLLETIGNILDMSKIETGQITLKNRNFSVNSLMKDIYSVFCINADDNIQFKYQNGLPDEDSLITGDEIKINQILTNLINNAFKFTSKGSIEFGYVRKNDFLEFYVKDTGVGIPKEYFHLMFTRFAQIDLSISRGYEGSGLGLAICKGLVELLGGKIRFESELGKGTTYYFTIPYTQAELIPEPKTPNIEVIADNKQCSILIAEDDWASFQYLERLLAAKYTIIHAKNGEEAVRLFKEHTNIRLILMDIKMPVMNGLEATKAIKEINNNIPIIAQTAYAFSSEREEILSIGCSDYISKPIEREKLMEIMYKYLK